MSSVWFDCTEPSLTTSLQGTQKGLNVVFLLGFGCFFALQVDFNRKPPQSSLLPDGTGFVCGEQAKFVVSN